MTVIEKLSDRGNLVVEAIKIILAQENTTMSLADLQYRLLKCGIFIKPTLLKQAVGVVTETDKRFYKVDGQKAEAQNTTQEKDTKAASEPGLQLSKS